MSQLISLFANNLLPIFLAAGTGYLAAKYLQVTPRSISQVAFYIFMPSLIFSSLTNSQLGGQEVSQMVGFAALTVLSVGALTALLGWLFRFPRTLLAAVLLTTMFGNAGNFGLSLNYFAFGEDGLAQASLFFVTTAILMYTVGVIIASLGKSGPKQALLGLFKIPVVYAVLVALIVNRLGWQMPLAVDRTISLLGQAAIPVLMVLMGVQLHHATANDHKFALGFSNVMRLVISPLIALGVNLIFRLQGPALQAGLTQAAVPTAIATTVLATEYDVEPAFVTSAVFVSTLLSPLTITPLLALLGAK